MKFSVLATLFLALSTPLLPLQAQDEIDMGVLDRTSEVKRIPVAVQSSNAELQGLLRRAFDVHGGYQLVSEGADYTFKVSPTGSNAVALKIESGQPAQTLYETTVRDESTQRAALRAADIAVEKTSGLPGIFAGQLVFISSRTGSTELYASDLFFTNIRQVTRDRSQVINPDLSPNGREVLYTSYFRNGFPDIYKTDLRTGNRDTFASFRGMNSGPAWSPDGNRVAMVLSGAGNAELYTANPKGRDMKRLTTTKGLEADPSWSPRGDRIAFASDELGRPQIYVIDAEGGSMSRVPTNISRYCAEPAWNPRDDDLLAFTCAQGGEFEVALYKFSTKKSEVVTRGTGDAVEPVWLRDGRHLIYTERTSSSKRLVLLDTATGEKIDLYNTRWGDSSQADYVYTAR